MGASGADGPEAGGAFRGTDSTAGGSPDSGNPQSGSGGQDPATLPSTVDFDYDVAASQDVVLRFTPLPHTAVRAQLFAMNGFE